ncbi:dTDP-4-dehydrorhamnose 3,5-epimerase [Paraburkholderia sp. UCT31]|uniref:dTDP-4-dehydrorhamnose 3,5-epimerase n=1 Tax=Paraburkholderia sp. UCT31 TaxID=2615209 RepID=UPI00165512F1|nr:dTDP-4-dehydrorhamnose 3,5-epimerase [Paraburkholderia sp. UCT31]MBC8739241.1 dTDP-4-dehydrorhamnose 3,5-epimerase [Paraburkholderia sp. UCT31]
MQGISLTPLKRIATPGGDVLHGMKATDHGFSGFGEAYFSMVNKGAVKGWKLHRAMTLNFVVPCGEIQVRVYDETTDTSRDFRLSPSTAETYARLTIPPKLWVAFGGLGEGVNLLLNLASIPHDPMESERRDTEAFTWSWLETR